MPRRHRDAVTIAGRHGRHPAPVFGPQRKGAFLEFDFGPLVEIYATEQRFQLFAPELVGDARGRDVRAFDQRLGHIVPATGVAVADAEARDRERRRRLIATRDRQSTRLTSSHTCAPRISSTAWNKKQTTK